MGLDALADGEHRCEAVALDPAEVCEVPVAALSVVASQLPGLQRQLMRVNGQSIALDRDHAEMLTRRHANARISLFLHRLAARLGHIYPSPLPSRLALTRPETARHPPPALPPPPPRPP